MPLRGPAGSVGGLSRPGPFHFRRTARPPPEGAAMTDTSQITEVTAEDRTGDAANPGEFDFAQWMAGFQPTRKACVLYGRTDLLAVIDRLDEEARLPGLTDEQKRELLAEAQKTLETLKASGVEFVVQTMSVYAQKELMERLGHKTKDDPVTHEMECAFLAAHIVEPTGVTGEDIAGLYKASPQQVEKLSRVVRMVDTESPTITAPFSSKS